MPGVPGELHDAFLPLDGQRPGLLGRAPEAQGRHSSEVEKTFDRFLQEDPKEGIFDEVVLLHLIFSYEELVDFEEGGMTFREIMHRIKAKIRDGLDWERAPLPLFPGGPGSSDSLLGAL